MPKASTDLEPMCPPFELEAVYLKCECWSGMDFLGALHGVPVNFPVKSWLAPDKRTQRQASIIQLDSIATEAYYSWEQTTAILCSKNCKTCNHLKKYN